MVGTFDEVRFPEEFSFDSSVSLGYRNAAHKSSDGSDYSIQFHGHPLRKYEVRLSGRTRAELRELYSFYMARNGGVNGFRLKDPTDFTSSLDGVSAHSRYDQVMAFSFSTSTMPEYPTYSPLIYQLVKHYADAGGFYKRIITKPVSGTTMEAANGGTYTKFTVDTATGLVTQDDYNEGYLITAGFEFDVPVIFSPETDRIMQAALKGDNSSDVMITLHEIPILHALKQSGSKVYPVQDEHDAGGYKNLGAIYDSVYVTGAEARVWAMTPMVNSLKVYIDDPSLYPPGGPHLILINQSTTRTMEVCNKNTGAAIDTIYAAPATSNSRATLMFVVYENAYIWISSSRTGA